MSESLTIVDENIGRSLFAVNLNAMPCSEFRKALRQIQTEILNAAAEPNLFACPVNTLHLSIFPIVWARGEQSVSQKKSVWNKYQSLVTAALLEVAKTTDKFCLEQPTVEFRDSAIILKFPPSPVLEEIRERTCKIVRDTELIWNRPDIQHITLCRYLKPVSLAQLKAKSSMVSFPQNIRWTVYELHLMQENVYPLLEVENLYKFRLVH